MFHRMKIRQRVFISYGNSRADRAFSHTQADQGLVMLSGCELSLESGNEFNHGILFKRKSQMRQ